VPRLGRGTLSLQSAHDLGIVVTHPLDRIDTVRAVRPVRELHARSRWVVYLTPGVDGAGFRHAERGGAHVFGRAAGVSLAEESRLGAVTDWFDRAAARRHGAHRPVTAADRENIDALVQVGASDTMALGLTRLGLTTAVLALIDRDPELGPARAADFYLTHVRRVADALEVAPADLALTTSAAHDVLRLVTSGRIHPKDAAALIERTVRDPATPPESLARSTGLLTDQDSTRLAKAVRAALDALDLTPEQIRLSQGKERRRNLDRLLDAIRRAHPDLNPRAAAEHVERLWEPPG
jgi:hypothetical protein